MTDFRRGAVVLGVAMLTVACGGEGAAKPGGDSAATTATARPAAGRGEGYTLRFTSSSTVERGRVPRGADGTARTEMMGTVKLQGGKARLDFNQLPQSPTSGAPSAIQEGGFMLLDAGTKRFIMVNPKTREAIQMDGDLSAAMAGPMMPKFDVSDVTSRTEDLGAGETILGFATRKYRISNAYTLSVSMMGQTQRMRNEQVTEVQSSDEIAAFDPAFAMFQETFQNSFGGIMKDVVDKLKAANPTGFAPRGFVLAQTSRNLVVANGDTTVTNSTLRVTQFQPGAVVASEFAVPADVKVVDLKQMMAESMKRAGRAAGAATP
jgi:hypothetical protein